MRIGASHRHEPLSLAYVGLTTGNRRRRTVLIDSDGQLGTINSSRRFKKEIKPMDKASEAILGLKPVTFHYKSDGTGHTAVWFNRRGSSRGKS